VNFNLSPTSISPLIDSPKKGSEPYPPSLSPESPSIAIRVAEVEDIESLAEILTQSFHPFKGVLLWLTPLLKLGIYEDLCSRLKAHSPHYVCLVAITAKGTDKEQIVGTIEINLRSPKFWFSPQKKNIYPYISNLAVSTCFRRRGVARQLLAKCDCIALGWGCRGLNLHVLENNQCAQGLYYGSGYEFHRAESTWIGWLFKLPRRLLLEKKL
jgi:ribosomal protein S18 acetylase RimI-like enzyme